MTPLSRKGCPWLLPIALLAAWQLAANTSDGLNVLPAPVQIGEALLDALVSGRLPADALHTFGAALAAWGICLVVGIPLGMALGSSAKLRVILSLIIELLRPVPAVALIPLAILVFGFSLQTEISVTVFASVWPVLFSSKSGIERLHSRMFEVAATLHLSRSHALRSVVTPAALREILVGARLSFSLCLVVSVVAEMVGNPVGLGWGLVSAQEAMKASEMFAYLFAIGMLGVFANFALDFAVGRLLPGLYQRN
ncbi:ABC transporter permease subunit [Paraburkholderia sp. A3BS-1L]|uniref:ABC transporter permease n=1 Tax=Paraburkholderia sp. A3BS-1L TaxID=3028375 RepID=UPI003DAA082A